MCKKDCVTNSSCVCPGHNQGSLSSHQIVGLSAGRTNPTDSHQSSRQLEKRCATSLAPFAPAGVDLHDLLNVASPSLTFSDPHVDWPSVPLDKALEIQTNIDKIDHFLNVLDDDEERETRELELAKKLSLSPQFSQAVSPATVLPQLVAGPVELPSSSAAQPLHPPSLSAVQPPSRPRDARKPTITKQMSDVWFRKYQNNMAEPSKKAKQKRPALHKFILVYWHKV
jgi:hypothetical protein